MKEYHKINSIFKRDEKNRFIIGEYAMPEIRILENIKYHTTEKIDGMNIRIHWDGNKVTFGGRTSNAQIPALLVEVLLNKFPSEKFTEIFGRTVVTLFGEGYGYKIQEPMGSTYLKDTVAFILFDVLIGIWLEPSNIEGIAEKFNVESVPYIGEYTILEAIDYIKSKPNSLIGGKMEGVVMKLPLYTRNQKRLIIKIKVRDFKDEN